jgi:hypothetical protein
MEILVGDFFCHADGDGELFPNGDSPLPSLIKPLGPSPLGHLVV